MRCLIFALVLAGMIADAFAADRSEVPTLRGSDAVAPAQLARTPIVAPKYPDWSGVYFGVQTAHTTASVDFGNGTSSLIHHILRNSILDSEVSQWTTLSQADTVGKSYGGFVGYNTSWDEIVLGMEANYSRTSLSQAAADSLSRVITNNTGAPPGHTFSYDVTVSASASVHITDLATVRARAGWAAGQFLLPYAFVGLAIGRADVSRSAAVSGTLTDSFDVTATVTDPITGLVTTITTPTSTKNALVLTGPQTESLKGVFAYGYTAGLGVDFALTQNLFVRGEWEWIQFAPIKDTRVHINTVRAAVALKF
jgi:opacity protein-like surface antigen